MNGVDDVAMTTTSEDLHRWSALAGSEESDDLVRSARAHFASSDPRAAFRAALSGVETSARTERWLDAGYADVGLPEHLGGVGSLVDLALVLDAAGRELLGDGLLATCGARQLQAAVGVTSPGRGAFAAVDGVVDGDGRVRVTDALVVDGLLADTVTLLVHGEGAQHVVVIDPETPGGSRGPVGRDHDPTRPACRLTLEAVAPESISTVSTDRGETTLAAARTCVAADLAGTATAALDLALDHVRAREQFGRPIGGFQAVKHQLADAFVDVEAARSLVLGAAVDNGTPDATRLSLLALAAAGDAARRSSALAVQMMGAMGVTFEADAHLVLRRTQQTLLLLESTRKAYTRAADLTLGGPRA